MHIITLIISSIILASCHPQKMIYKPITNSLFINDSINVTIDNGELLLLDGFHYSIQLHVDNESYLSVYIDKQGDEMKAAYRDIAVPYTFNYISDTIIKAHSRKNIHLSFYGKRMPIGLDFLNHEDLKKNHQFVMDLYFIVGESIVKKEIIFKPK